MSVIDWIDELEDESETTAVVKAEVAKTKSAPEEVKIKPPTDAGKFYAGKGTPCIVGVSIGLTISTGQFENVRPAVSIRIPADGDKVNEAYEYAYNFVDTHLSAMKKEVEEEIDV